jgi:AraC-like DNA-binding protein
MNVLNFTIPVPGDQSIILKSETGSYFYPHLHRHEEIQLTWVQRGEGTLVVNNEMYAFQPNEIYCIGANQPHVFKSNPAYFSQNDGKEVKALTVFFNPNGKLKSLFELSELKSVSNLFHKSGAGFIVPLNETAEISSIINDLFHQGGIEQMISFMNLLSKLTNIDNLKKFSRLKEYSGVTETEGVRISNIYHFIMMNYARQITLEDVSEKANMTPQAFCRYFKKRTLKTFVAFLNEVRINEACTKLTDENLNGIASIAYDCGFNSVTHFNRVFKAITGKSPRQYASNFIKHAYETSS